MYDEVVPPGAYWTRTLHRWQRLRITDLDGAQGCALLAYNPDQPSERYNAPDTVKVQNQIFLTTGRVLLSDLGRVLCSVVDDTSVHHDTLAGFSDAARGGRSVRRRLLPRTAQRVLPECPRQLRDGARAPRPRPA